MRLLFIGDIFGSIGKRILADTLPGLCKEIPVDCIIANGENAAGGRGLTHAIIRKLRIIGIPIITGGNHSLVQADAYSDFVIDPYLLRPANIPLGNIGKGFCVYQLSDGRKLGVMNLIGRTYMNDHYDCPFRTFDSLLTEAAPHNYPLLLDFHAEATAEKKAMLAHVDGRISALVGTHTHVQTSDEQITDRGTAYITDVGMTGPEKSAIGMKYEQVVKKFIFQTHVRYEPSEEGPMLNAVHIDIDDATHKASSITRIYKRL